MTVLPLGRVYAAGPVTDEQLATLGLVDVGLRLASIDPNVPTSNTWQMAAARPITPADTTPAPVGVTDACIEFVARMRGYQRRGRAVRPRPDRRVRAGRPACVADVSAMGPNGHFELAGLLEQGARDESNDRAADVTAEDPVAE